jgi:hypothetical protein
MGTSGALLRRPLIVATVLVATLATSGATAGATSTTTTSVAPSVQSICGVVASPSVHFVSKSSPCVIRVRRGTHVQIRLRSGLRWGNPTSSSRAVVVFSISRNSIGVFAATLHATAVGRATIHTTGTVYCKPGLMCPDLALLWTLQVIVTS